jgi:hypothetical protein
MTEFDKAIAQWIDKTVPGKGYGARYLAFIKANPGLAGSPTALAIWIQQDHIPITPGQANQIFAGASATGHWLASVIGAHAQSSNQLPNLTGLAAIGDFFSKLSQGNTWIRIGEAFLGLILIAAGLAKLTHAVPIATKIASVVK